MFIGRKAEINFLNAEIPVFELYQEEDVDLALAQRDKILFVLYGRRRVGKTFKFLKLICFCFCHPCNAFQVYPQPIARSCNCNVFWTFCFLLFDCLFNTVCKNNF